MKSIPNVMTHLLLCFLFATWLSTTQSVALAQSGATSQTDMLKWATETSALKFKPRNPPRPVPKTLDDEQRAMLTESPNLFPYLDSKHLREPNLNIFWMDDVRIITSVRKLGDWQMADGEQPKVVILHTDKDALEETSYRGDISCYSPERMVLVQLPNAGAHASRGSFGNLSKTGTLNSVLTGKFGEALINEEYIKTRTDSARFNHFDCKPFHAATSPPARDGYLIYPLREGDGTYGSRSILDTQYGKPHTVLFDAQGNIRFPFPEGDGVFIPSFGEIQYNTTTQRYFISNTDACGDTGKGSARSGYSISFKANGQDYQIHALPPVLLSMIDWCVAQWSKYDTAIGVLYIDSEVYDTNPFRGLYVHLNGKTHRLVNAPVRVLSVSPSGCRVSIFFPAREARGREKVEFVRRIFNLCQGEKK